MGYCQKCGEKWRGLGAAHCSGCHRTFRSVGGFDAHRVQFACVDPEELGMEMNKEGVWRKPMPEEAKKAYKNGRR